MASEHVSFGDFAIFIRRSNENPKIAKNRLRKRMNKGFGDFDGFGDCSNTENGFGDMLFMRFSHFTYFT
jgi:hypothetical protein